MYFTKRWPSKELPLSPAPESGTSGRLSPSMETHLKHDLADGRTTVAARVDLARLTNFRRAVAAVLRRGMNS